MTSRMNKAINAVEENDTQKSHKLILIKVTLFKKKMNKQDLKIMHEVVSHFRNFFL